jgi:hypothetical protein
MKFPILAKRIARHWVIAATGAMVVAALAAVFFFFGRGAETMPVPGTQARQVAASDAGHSGSVSVSVSGSGTISIALDPPVGGGTPSGPAMGGPEDPGLFIAEDIAPISDIMPAEESATGDLAEQITFASDLGNSLGRYSEAPGGDGGSKDNPDNETKQPVIVSPVPEPEGWALMIGGFLIAGAALRRRSRRGTTATA